MPTEHRSSDLLSGCPSTYSVSSQGLDQWIDQRMMMRTKDSPTVLAAEVSQERRRGFLWAGDHVKIGPELGASFPEKS